MSDSDIKKEECFCCPECGSHELDRYVTETWVEPETSLFEDESWLEDAHRDYAQGNDLEEIFCSNNECGVQLLLDDDGFVVRGPVHIRAEAIGKIKEFLEEIYPEEIQRAMALPEILKECI